MASADPTVRTRTPATRKWRSRPCSREPSASTGGCRRRSASSSSSGTATRLRSRSPCPLAAPLAHVRAGPRPARSLARRPPLTARAALRIG
jgi:hypothetical protein